MFLCHVQVDSFEGIYVAVGDGAHGDETLLLLPPEFLHIGYGFYSAEAEPCRCMHVFGSLHSGLSEVTLTEPLG